MNFPELWQAGMTYSQFVEAASPIHRGLWEGIYRLARAPEWAVVADGSEPRHFLALAEDWCGDAVNTLPIVIALDAAFNELGHWGPRPRELQQWVMADRATMPKPERYRQARRWYAEDGGQSTIRELMQAAMLPAPAR